MVKKGEWSQEEMQFLKDNFIKMTLPELSVALNRSISSVNNKRTHLKLERSKKLKEYRESYIKEQYKKKLVKDIAVDLGISRRSVTRIITRLGLSKPMKKSKYDSNMIYALYKGEELIIDGNVEEIAEHIGTSVNNVIFYNSNVNRKRETGGNRRMLVFLYDENEVE